MENLSKRHIIITSLIIFVQLFTGCKKYNIETIEDFTHLELSDRITFMERIDEWENFQGDGTAIFLFNIKKDSIDLILNEVDKDKWLPLNKKSDLVPVDILSDAANKKYTFGKMQGYYLKIEDNVKNEIRVAVIDTCNNRFIYYYVFL